jgi:hypothetical protein
MEKEQSFKAGDIFSVEIAPNEYAFGRVLLDVYKQCVEKGYIGINHSLAVGDRKTIFIEFYREVFNEKRFDVENPEVLIPGIFTLNLCLLDFEWEVVGHKPVDPVKVDFPESLTIDGAFKGKFIKGELDAQVIITAEEIEQIGIYPSLESLMAIPEFILYSLGRQDEIKEERRQLRDLKNIDLRFSDYRDKIYALLPSEFNKPYYELAKEKGFDLARFYE